MNDETLRAQCGSLCWTAWLSECRPAGIGSCCGDSDLVDGITSIQKVLCEMASPLRGCGLPSPQLPFSGHWLFLRTLPAMASRGLRTAALPRFASFPFLFFFVVASLHRAVAAWDEPVLAHDPTYSSDKPWYRDSLSCINTETVGWCNHRYTFFASRVDCRTLSIHLSGLSRPCPTSQ